MTDETPVPPKKQSNREDALAVVRRLREAGHIAYFAGGCVRDQLLGLEPKDYDVATDAPPGRVRELFLSTQAVGAAFGVILVRQRKSQIEVATFRTDGKYVDGRRPEGVTFATAEEDAKRRDFTINGMFFDPVEERVIDYVGGQEDLKNKVLRAIGDPDHRFEEDHLRLLRAVRFAARFGLQIERRTQGAMIAHAEQLKRISPERIAEELRLMLTPRSRINAYDLLYASGLLPVLFRFLPDRQCWRPEPFALFKALGPPLEPEGIPFGLALAGLTLSYRIGLSGTLDPVPLLAPAEVKRACRAVRDALKISNDELEMMSGSLSFEHLIGESPPTLAIMKRFLAALASSEARRLMAAVARIPEPALSERIERVLDRLRALARTDFAPPPLVTGDDLTAAGLAPGPVFKRVLEAVYDAQLEDGVGTKEEAMKMAMEMARAK